MMPPEFNQQNLTGEPYQMKGNQSFLLHNPQTVWVVQSGEIGLFRVASNEGMPIGARRYLFSCKAGEALFGIVPTDDQPYGLLAVALEETDLLKVDRKTLELWIAEANPAVTSLLETWMKHYQALLDTAGDDRAFSLEQRLSSRSPETSLFAPNLTLESLLQFNTQFLASLDQFEEQEQAAEWSRFQMQDRFNHQASEAAIASLASLLNPDVDNASRFAIPPDLTAEQAQYLSLYKAAQRVAQALGISLQLPAKSENLARLKEPLDAIARASRVRIRRVLLSDRWWRKDCGPLLAYLRPENRPVALIASAPGRYQLFDPVAGTYTPITAATQAQLFSVAYVFYRPLPERITQLLEVLHFGLKGSTKDWSVIFWAGIATTLLGMLLPQCLAILIDQAIPDANHELLLQLGFGLLAAIVGGLVFQLAQGVALMRIETLVESSTQTALWDRLLSLGAPFFRQYSVGDLRERVAVMGSIRHQITGVVLRTLFTSTFALLNLALLFYYSSSLAMVASAVAVIVGIVTIAVGSVTLRQVPPLQALEGKIFGLMVQLINGVAKLRVTGAEARAFAHWGKQYSHQQMLKLKMQQLEDTLLVFNQLLPILSAVVLFGVAARLGVTQAAGRLSTGTFLAFNVAFGSFIVGVTELSNTVLNSLVAIALWQRAQPILQAQPEVDGGKTEPGQLSGSITLSHLTFRYRPDGPATLDDVTIEVSNKEFIAIVGPSGSGKSTLFRLLLGFETPQAGQVYYDGQDLRGLNIHSVRRQLGVLLQNSRTSTASIFENIAGNALITMDEAWEAANYAGLADEINAMPMGMHTVVSEGGSNLSGGQRQRLLIARSLALKPRILLFDEATSALDNRTQTIVSESLERLQITRIVIAHRLSTIRNADRIYVLQAGRIVQHGRFEALIEQDGMFRQLMQQQIA